MNDMNTDTAFTKVIRPATVEHGRARASVFCKINFDGEKLSISGVIGPNHHGGAMGGCGQIDMEFAHRNPGDDDTRYSSPIKPEEMNFADGWDADLWLDFLYVWKHYHLNTLHAECEHQRALGWKYSTHSGRCCPECGYKIGTAWLRVEVPPVVLNFLRNLPDADREPAWV